MRYFFFLLLCCAGCSPDTDLDGLTDREERELGTDPILADSDGDRLSDGDELLFGTDPLVPDTDGDGYLDGDEVVEGSDPTDATSVIYVGGWPYNPNKDAMEDPGWDGVAVEGEMLPRFQWMDQYGDVVDIYDFAGQGKPVMIDLSGLWCYWCHEVAAWLERDESRFDDYPQYEPIREMVEEGEIYWITLIDAGYESGIAPTDLDIALWWFRHDNPLVPVLADSERQFGEWLQVTGYPSMVLLDESLRVDRLPVDSYLDLWDVLLED